MKTYVSTDYEECEYITAGKLYEVDEWDYGDNITDDAGDSVAIAFERCLHIGNNDWTVHDVGTIEEIGAKVGDVIADVTYPGWSSEISESNGLMQLHCPDYYIISRAEEEAAKARIAEVPEGDTTIDNITDDECIVSGNYSLAFGYECKTDNVDNYGIAAGRAAEVDSSSDYFAVFGGQVTPSESYVFAAVRGFLEYLEEKYWTFIWLAYMAALIIAALAVVTCALAVIVMALGWWLIPAAIAAFLAYEIREYKKEVTQ